MNFENTSRQRQEIRTGAGNFTYQVLESHQRNAQSYH